MKELNIVKQMVADGQISQEVAEKYFPKLKESEDELTWLKGFIREEIDCLSFDIRNSEDRVKLKNLQRSISWLEKQGETFTKKDVDDAYLKGICDAKQELEKQGSQIFANSAKTCKDEPRFKVKYAGSEYNVFEIKELAGITFYGIEDEPNHIDYVKADNCEIISGGYGIKENGSPYPTKPAVFSEQKPADKVESKFKVGDWVVVNDRIGRIIECTKDFADIDLEFSCLSTSPKNIRSWTIQDAKDGDVLCIYECDEPKIVFILKGTPKKHYALSYHCYYNIMYSHFMSDSEKGCLAPNDKDVKPATQEQRERLFQNIKEAGYEWDAEKKELKKIKQNPAWKPSDMQIGLLQAIVNEPNNAASESCQIALKEVIRQLKKLREE